jgi:hypothetical protein
MLTWPKNPRIYEINTLVWLREMSAARGSDISLATVPKEAWNALAELGMDAVWLMGVWERSPLGKKIALEHPGLGDDYRTVLEDLHEEDVLDPPTACTDTRSTGGSAEDRGSRMPERSLPRGDPSGARLRAEPRGDRPPGSAPTQST